MEDRDDMVDGDMVDDGRVFVVINRKRGKERGRPAGGSAGEYPRILIPASDGGLHFYQELGPGSVPVGFLFPLRNSE